MSACDASRHAGMERLQVVQREDHRLAVVAESHKQELGYLQDWDYVIGNLEKLMEIAEHPIYGHAMMGTHVSDTYSCMMGTYNGYTCLTLTAA